MIKSKTMDFLFDTLKFFDDQYSEITDTCFEDVNRALIEIKDDFLPKNTKIMPYGSYYIKTNYQIIEPMEFYVVLNGEKDAVLSKEYEQKQQSLKKNKQKQKDSSIKFIYQNILSGSSSKNDIVTSFDAAKIIMEQMQKYLGEDDVVYYKNNVVFVKFHTKDGIQILATITIVYDFDCGDDKYEFKKYGISTKENSKAIIHNLLEKNAQTNGNFLVLCKLIKMLELELVITNMSFRYLSKKSLFVENILYNVPNSLYKDNDFCKLFLNITNYVKHCDVNNLLLADNITKMFTEHGYYAKNELASFIKKLIYLNQNTDKLIEDALKNYEKNNNNKSPDNINENNVKTDKKIKKLGK